jgi:hypothetical protein
LKMVLMARSAETCGGLAGGEAKSEDRRRVSGGCDVSHEKAEGRSMVAMVCWCGVCCCCCCCVDRGICSREGARWTWLRSGTRLRRNARGAVSPNEKYEKCLRREQLARVGSGNRGVIDAIRP